MKKKKISIESPKPITSIREVERVVDAFVKRGGYITLEEDLGIRKRILNGNYLASWIRYVKSKLTYKREKIAKQISETRKSLKKKKKALKLVPTPVTKPVNENLDDKVTIKKSLNIDSYADIYREDPKLYPYQQKAKKEIFESWDEVDSVMFQMPTGTGKTRLFTSIISDINKYSIQRKEPVKILIIAHRTELIDQIDENLERYGVPHNIIAGSRKREIKYPVHVASIQTITHPSNLEKAKKLNVQFVIIDEAHHALAKTYKKLWDIYPEAKRLGVTATPWRMNHQSFTDLFDKLVLSMPVKDFINQGYLSPYKYFSLKPDSNIHRTIEDIELDKFGEYMESSMEEKMDIGSIRAQLLDSYLSLAKGKKGIIYAINRMHAKHICKEYENAGYRTVSIDSNTPSAERKYLVEKFKRGQIDIIVNVDIFSEGFDCPDIEFIQLARPTRSLVKYLQQVGRGLRKVNNKEHCIILDNVGMYAHFGLPDARRHWKYHFLGKEVDEEPRRMILGLGGGGGHQREVDLSEGTEDMELIQDDYIDVEPIEESKSAIDDFFPLFGFTLGKTTWKDAEDLGCQVKISDKGKPDRFTHIKNVWFWDFEGKGVFTSLYWVRDWRGNDMPSLWESKGLSWDISYDEWMAVFGDLGFEIKITKQPIQRVWKGRTVLNAEFKALSPDGMLVFRLIFNYGELGYFTSSPKSLYSISVNYKGEIMDDKEEEDEKEDSQSEESFYDANGVSHKPNCDTLLKYPSGIQCDSIEIPDFIKYIGSRAFEDNKPSEIIFHDEILDLQDHIFANCKNLTTITMRTETPDDIEIDSEAFSGFEVDKCVLRVPFNVLSTYKKDGRFNEFKYITAIEGSRCLMYDDEGTKIIGCDEEYCENLIIPEGVIRIEEDAFGDNKKIKTVSFPESLIEIGYGAFSGCSGITTIKLNDELEKIEADAFRATGLEKVEIPKNVNDIGATAFSCEMLVPSLNKNYYVLDGVLFDNRGTKLIIYPSSKHGNHYVVPVDTLAVGYYAFEDSCLKSISFPASIKSLGVCILNRCDNLKKLYINVVAPNEMYIHKDAFNGFNKSQCKLFVPAGCKDKYSSHDLFKDFLSIEEMEARDDEEKVTQEEYTNIIDDNEIETVYVDIPSADPYTEHEYDAPEKVEIEPPHYYIDPKKLDKIFDKKTTSYKYFWFIAIISLAKERNSLTIPYRDIVIRMAAIAWPIVFKDKIDLGRSDMLPKYLNDIIKNTNLPKDIPSKVVEAYMSVYYDTEGIDKILEPLLKNVPYRFLSPWIKYTTDEEVIEKSNSEEYACLYALNDDYLVLHPEWVNYIKANYKSICDSAERSFITHAKQKNIHNRFTRFMAVGWSLV